ncbi:hypothetical protein GCM10010275_12350 [Streptomyces litmocidini]|nr:hypothetical protein GCM10010275_12350 [Streptomyces litmocidini]
MTFVDRLPAAVSLGEVSPRDPGPHPEQDPVDHLAVVTPASTAQAGGGQMQRKPHPLRIRQITPPHARTNDRTSRQSQDPPDRP